MDLFVVNADGSDLHRVTADETRSYRVMCWTANGEIVLLAETAQGSDFWLLRADGGGLRRPTVDGNRKLFSAQACSADGTSLAYVDMTTSVAHVIDLSHGDPQETAVGSVASAVSLSPDGRYLAARIGGWISRIELRTLETLPLTPAGTPSSSPGVWSPDGTHLVFAEPLPPYGLTSDLHVVATDGSSERSLSLVFLSFVAEPSWSPIRASDRLSAELRPLRRLGAERHQSGRYVSVNDRPLVHDGQPGGLAAFAWPAGRPST